MLNLLSTCAILVEALHDAIPAQVDTRCFCLQFLKQLRCMPPTHPPSRALSPRRPTNEDGTTCSTRPDRQNVTPPQKHPLGLIDGIIEESRHPLAPSPAKDRYGDSVGAGLPGPCNSAGSGTGNGVGASEGNSSSAAAAAGVGFRGVDDADQLVGNGGSEAGAASFHLPANPGRSSFGASTGGGGGGGASLFDMVMSGASSCSPQSSNGGAGSNGGRSRLSVAATTGARAEGGKPVASSLSGMLGGMRGRQPTSSSRDEEGCRVAARGAGVGQTSTEDWMAINLEKLSNFRVPETRMGFPEGGRQVRTCEANDVRLYYLASTMGDEEIVEARVCA